MIIAVGHMRSRLLVLSQLRTVVATYANLKDVKSLCFTRRATTGYTSTALGTTLNRLSIGATARPRIVEIRCDDVCSKSFIGEKE